MNYMQFGELHISDLLYFVSSIKRGKDSWRLDIMTARSNFVAPSCLGCKSPELSTVYHIFNPVVSCHLAVLARLASRDLAISLNRQNWVSNGRIFLRNLKHLFKPISTKGVRSCQQMKLSSEFGARCCLINSRYVADRPLWKIRELENKSRIYHRQDLVLAQLVMSYYEVDSQY